MKTIRFEKLTIRNFMSFGDEVTEVPLSNGLNLITGYNLDMPESKNGIGKTSIVDAILFALYDTTTKDLNKADLVNDSNKKNCVVTLDFNIEQNGKTTKYRIERGIAPGFCTFFIDGDSTKSTLSSMPLTYKNIEKHLGISRALFQQAIIMSVGDSVSFFKIKKQDKKNFIEGTFDLDIFSKMLKDVSAEHTTAKNSRDTFELQLKSEEQSLSQFIEKDNGFEAARDEFIATLEEQNAESTKKVEALKLTILDVPDDAALRTELSTITTKIKGIDDVLRGTQSKCDGLSRDITSLEREIRTLESIGDVCSKCNRDLDKAEVDARKVEISNKKTSVAGFRQSIAEINKKLPLVNATKSKLDDNRENIRNKIASIQGIQSKNSAVESHIVSLKKTIKDTNAKIESKRIEVSSFSELIEKFKAKIADLREKLEKSRNDCSVLESCKFVLSEEGVKSVIIKELKLFINTRLNEYLRKLDTPVICKFDEYFEETLTNKFGVPKSYNALSGGERKRLDLAVLFTLQDMLNYRSGVDVQLAFYDEILDTSIDEYGRKKVLELLKEKSTDSAIYVISHRSKMSELIDKEIVLEKHNDFTTIKVD